MLAYAHRHSVIGLTLPPIDANTFFIMAFSLPGVLEKKPVQFSVASRQHTSGCNNGRLLIGLALELLLEEEVSVVEW